MLRSRNNNKNAHKQNGATIQDPSYGSSFTKYGLLICIFFIIAIAYVAFVDNHSVITSNTNTNQKSSKKTAPLLNAMAAKMTPNIGLLNPKVLADLNPSENAKLERLIERQDRKVPFPRNKLNKLQHPLTPLKVLTERYSDTKEIHFTLHAPSLPKAPGKQPSIFIRQSFPAQAQHNHDFVLLFLHGAAYSSAIWSELGILSAFAKQGYTSYALDIPGYGQSAQIMITNNKWLYQIIDQLIGNDKRASNHIVTAGGVNTAGKKVIIVTASMSGRFAVPLLFDLPTNMVGLITIAPVGTERFKKEEYAKVPIPVCIIYGENDLKLAQKSKENLIQIPNHKLIMVPGGQHAAYKTDPKFFHQQVVKWLNEFFD